MHQPNPIGFTRIPLEIEQELPRASHDGASLSQNALDVNHNIAKEPTP